MSLLGKCYSSLIIGCIRQHLNNTNYINIISAKIPNGHKHAINMATIKDVHLKTQLLRKVLVLDATVWTDSLLKKLLPVLYHCPWTSHASLRRDVRVWLTLEDRAATTFIESSSTKKYIANLTFVSFKSLKKARGTNVQTVSLLHRD